MPAGEQRASHARRAHFGGAISGARATCAAPREIATPTTIGIATKRIHRMEAPLSGSYLSDR